MSAPFVLLERGAGVIYGACEGIFVMMLFAQPTVADMNLARPALRTMSERYPDGFPTLTWVLPQAGDSMDSDARNAATEVSEELDRWILAEATLIVGTGFRAATARAIVAELDLMSRSSSVKNVFADLPEAVAWCLSQRRARDVVSEADVTASLFAMRTSVELGR